jgi:MFS family permease
MVLPLALAQFVASYAGTNMNVAISTIADDIGTTVRGMQTTITLFTLTMASLMIPGSKVTDIFGRKRCFLLGLSVYGLGALLASVAGGLGLMIFGYSLLEGIGSALLIPPIYILVTVLFDDTKTRAKYFGVVSGAAGLGAAAGPLIGGLVTSAISWRASFGLQVAAVVLVIFLTRRHEYPESTKAAPTFDFGGAVLGVAGLFFVVLGILLSGTYGWGKSREDLTVGGTVIISKGSLSPVWYGIAIGVAFLVWFYLHCRRRERRSQEPLVATHLFHNKTSNLGLGTQTIQWLTMQGSFFVISVYLQQVNGYSAIKTGLLLTPATVGILTASAAAERMAGRRNLRTLIRGGFVLSAVGMGVLLAFGRAASLWALAPGLLVMGFGVGIMLTASVNVVQSAFPEQDQSEISGVSRSASNLGSSIGTALAGSILVAAATPQGHPFAAALAVLVVITLIGLGLALLLPRQPQPGVVSTMDIPTGSSSGLNGTDAAGTR